MANPLTRLAVRAVAAAASRQIANRVSGAHLGPLGNAAAVALPFVLRRVSPLGMAAIAVGAWGVGQLARSAPATAAPAAPTGGHAKPAAGHERPAAGTVTPPPIAWAAAADGF